MSRIHRRVGRPSPRFVAAVMAVGFALGVAACGGDESDITVGLITKQEENPYWVKMREVAEKAAEQSDVKLLTATGESDVDYESQVQALEDMTEQGADGILIAPTDSQAVVPAIEAARDAGVIVIALDTPTEPESAVDATFATDNRRAGELIGRYAKAKAEEEGIEPKIAMLDLAPDITSGELRHDGFLAGFGIQDGDPAIVGSVNTEGNEAKARAGMERLVQREPDINIVYTVNEPAAFGAFDALEEAGIGEGEVILVSVDGGCDAIDEGIRTGVIDATAQQYPENMAREGVQAIVAAERDGEEPRRRLDTGVVLITSDPVEGAESEDAAFGMRNCWG